MTSSSTSTAHTACAAAALRLHTWLVRLQALAAQLVLLGAALVAASTARIETLLDEHPRLRATRNALGHIGAFVIGTTFVDERVAFSKHELVNDDAYRDRLLAPEIADLVDLCDALRLSLTQRKALFQCFRHLDCMRRAGVTRAELLRYCGLRTTPLSCFLLPESPDGATHRSGMAQRWDILQWFALCFSVCTLELDALLEIAIAEACRPIALEHLPSTARGVNDEQPTQRLESSVAPPHTADTAAASIRAPTLSDQIAQCFAFCVGVLSANERYLETLLCELYSDRDGVDSSGHKATEQSRLCFRHVHGVTSVLDVAKLFPVLVFPCVWTQCVLQRRTLGASTWRVLQTRRRELHAVGLTASFLTFSDIITAAQVHVTRKRNKKQQPSPHPSWSSVSAWLRAWLRCRRHLPASSHVPLSSSDNSLQQLTEAYASTPRKILPSTDAMIAASDGVALETSDHDTSVATTTDTNHMIGFANLDDAWRVTANNVIATICTAMQYRERLHRSADNSQIVILQTSTEDAREQFVALAQDVANGSLASVQCDAARRTLVSAYGYQFAHFVFAKSSVRDATTDTKPSAEERRTQQRYAKAYANRDVPDDKPSYWQQLLDPASKRAFYHNVRTGESRWEKPANVVVNDAKRTKRRVKHNKSKQL